MTITDIETILVSIPFEDGSAGEGLMPTAWTELDFALVRIETDAGLVGWGEGFGYFCHEAVAATIERAIKPLLVGRDPADPPALMEEVQRRMVLQGRHGISTFAQSGVDLALWDLKAKAEGVSVARLLGEPHRDSVPAYASLVRYGDAELVARYSEQSLAQGYRDIKLHEITMPEIRRCREVVGDAASVIVDVNCNWSESFVRVVAPELRELGTRWLEEPVFPPEDYRTLASLRSLGIPIATGENACTATPFAEMIALGGTDMLQPSVTKIGGISEFLKVAALAREAGLPLMPHSPYFGPGYLASLQLAAVDPNFELFEYLVVEPETWLFPEMPLPADGEVAIPQGPGLGIDPDPEVIARFRKSPPSP